MVRGLGAGFLRGAAWLWVKRRRETFCFLTLGSVSGWVGGLYACVSFVWAPEAVC